MARSRLGALFTTLLPNPLMERLVCAVWYEGHFLGWVLRPVAALFCLVVRLRRLGYLRGWFASQRLSVPVIVVGNLTVGGTGKTPTVLWLAQFLVAHGWRPGIISRGYGGRIGDKPQVVGPTANPLDVGDEPLLLARRSGVPVAVCRWRARAGELLATHYDCDCLIADDGLQHYALARDIEIALVDRARGMGNGLCLPAGPLREPLGRLREVSLRVAFGAPLPGEHPLGLVPGDVLSLDGDAPSRPLASFCATTVHGVAGIGHPQRFFSLLEAAGLTVIAHPFPDHHPFRPEDLAFGDDLSILMTEKDAVKCITFARNGQWYVPIDAHFTPEFAASLLGLLPSKPDRANGLH